jgi:hypothetical protein
MVGFWGGGGASVVMPSFKARHSNGALRPLRIADRILRSALQLRRVSRLNKWSVFANARAG